MLNPVEQQLMGMGRGLVGQAYRCVAYWLAGRMVHDLVQRAVPMA